MNPTFSTKHAGPLAFPTTPFHADGSLDMDTFRAHIRWLIEFDPPALFVASGAGEFPSLDPDECGLLVAAAVEEAGSEVPVYAGAGQGIRVARRFARVAEEAGAHGLLVFPPYLLRAEQEGLVSYYRQIAEASSLPLVAYQRGHAVFDVDTVQRLAEIPNVVGLKDGLGEIERMQSFSTALGDRLTFFNGMPTAETHQPAYAAMGVSNYSSAVFNFVPEVSWAFYTAMSSGDVQSVDRWLRTFFFPLARLRNRVRGYAVALVKAGVAIRWGSVGSVRAPLVDVKDEHVRELRDIVEAGLAQVSGA